MLTHADIAPRATRLLAAALLSACASNHGVEGLALAPSTASRIAFQMPPAEMVYGVRVGTCRGSRTMWAIGTASAPAAPTVVEYGVTPPGYSTMAGPELLTPGCYKVTVSGPATMRFEIRADGTVQQLDSLPVTPPRSP